MNEEVKTKPARTRMVYVIERSPGVTVVYSASLALVDEVLGPDWVHRPANELAAELEVGVGSHDIHLAKFEIAAGGECQLPVEAPEALILDADLPDGCNPAAQQLKNFRRLRRLSRSVAKTGEPRSFQSWLNFDWDADSIEKEADA